MFDVKIVGGTILDGSGAFRYKADVGIEGDKITAIGDLSAADAKKVTMLPENLFLPVSLISIHIQIYHWYMISTQEADCTGVTMDVIANCGIGVALSVKNANRN